MNEGKRQDIQILRAIALFMVLGYHLKIPLFKNGFLGVDVFFVISGYLMAQVYKSGHIKQFYLKRLARLLPAYYATILLTLIAGYVITVSSDFIQVLNQVRASILGIPNFYFWTQDSYFSDSNFNPLLHLWSLGIEMQFYLIVPLIALIMGRSNKPMILISVLSFTFCLITLTISPKTSFFLLPFRLWEFLIGYMGYSNFKRKIRSKNKDSNILFALIIIVIFFPADGQSVYPLIGHPGVLALIVTTMVFFILNSDKENSQNVIKKTLAKIGDASYSIYLVHFPIVIFFNYMPFNGLRVENPNFLQTIFLLVTIFIFGFLMYRIIEDNLRLIFLRFIPNLVAVVLILVLSQVFSQLKWITYSNTEKEIASAYFDRSSYRCGKIFRILNPNAKLCNLSSRISKNKILLLGNSHADAIKQSFTNSANKLDFQTYFWTQNDPLMKADGDIYTIINESKKAGIHKIYLHYSAGAVSEATLEKFIFAANLDSIVVSIILPVPTWGAKVPEILWLHSGVDNPKILQQSYKEFSSSNYESLMVLNRIAARHGLSTLDSAQILCRELCVYSSDSGKPYYWDEGHLTLTGARLLEDGFEELLKQPSPGQKK
jgi:peptidoglycan/LPS O-acetylase OafA/YrhL